MDAGCAERKSNNATMLVISSRPWEPQSENDTKVRIPKKMGYPSSCCTSRRAAPRSILLVENQALLLESRGGLHLEEAAEACEEKSDPQDADEHRRHDVRRDRQGRRAIHQRCFL